MKATSSQDLKAALGGDASAISVQCRSAADPTDQALERSLQELARSLEELGATVVQAEPAPSPALLPLEPALTLTSSLLSSRVQLMAAPRGPERAPILTLLQRLAGPASQGSGVAGVAPVELLVFVAPACTSCPAVVKAALEIVCGVAGSTLSIVDATHFTSFARGFGVQSVPTVVIDGGLTVIGSATRRALLDLIGQRGTGWYERAHFASLVEAGRHGDAAALLLRGEALEAFAALWRESTLHHRISLMIIAEDVIARSPSALDALIPGLLPVLDGGDIARRGDTVDLLGLIGNPSARGALEAALQDSNEDLVEAAAEALARLDEVDRDSQQRGEVND